MIELVFLERVLVAAALSGVIGFTVLGLIDRLEQRIPSAVYHTLTLGVVPGKRASVRNAVLEWCRRSGMRAQAIGWEWGRGDDFVTIRFRIRHRGTIDLSELAEEVSSLPGVERIELVG